MKRFDFVKILSGMLLVPAVIFAKAKPRPRKKVRYVPPKCPGCPRTWPNDCLRGCGVARTQIEQMGKENFEYDEIP